MKPRRSDPSAAGSKVVTMQKTRTTHAANDNDPTTPRAAAPLVFNKTTIRDRDQFLSLTDMWKAAGGEKSKQPANWLASVQARELIEFVEENQTPRNPGSLIETHEGRGGGTWAHWHIAFAYAKYLSPAFHVWCNEVVRAVMEGRTLPGPAKTSPDLSAEDVANIAAQVVMKGILPLVEAHRKMAEDLAQLRSELVALHRDHNNARDMAAIGGQCASERIRKPILRMAKEKARYLGGKAAEASFNRKFHLRVREACDGFSGSWDRLPRGLLGRAETCVANILREVRADTILAERHGYTPVQMKLDEGRDRRPN